MPPAREQVTCNHTVIQCPKVTDCYNFYSFLYCRAQG